MNYVLWFYLLGVIIVFIVFDIINKKIHPDPVWYQVAIQCNCGWKLNNPDHECSVCDNTGIWKIETRYIDDVKERLKDRICWIKVIKKGAK